MGVLASLPWKPIKGHSRAHVMDNIRNYEKAFSARYEAAYMWFFVQSVSRELENKLIPNKWQLSRRKWNYYNRVLKQGVVYVLSKRDGSRWKKRYCVLQSDYSLEFYKSKEEFEASHKPRFTAKYSGFLVTGDVDGHLHEKLTLASRDFGYVNPDINAFAKRVTLIGIAGKRPTQHVFLVDHPWRGTTYFATETAIEKDQWLNVFKDSIRHLEGCESDDDVGREAFAFAVEQSVRLQEFYVDRSMLFGTQEEVVTDLISAFQSVDCKEVVLPRITGGIVSKYKAWNWVLAVIHDIINGVVAKHYLTWKSVWEDKCHSKREQIIENLPRINQAYQNTAQIIREVLAECFDSILLEEILPTLPDIVNVMSDAFVSPLKGTRQLFKVLIEGLEKQVSNHSSEFANNIDQYFLNDLDFFPRDPEFTCPSGENWNHNGSAPLAFLKNVFPSTDFSLHLKSVYTYQQELLDSAVFTFENLCGNSIKLNDGQLSLDAVAKIKEQVLKKLDYDILLAQKRFFRLILLSATMERAREAIEHNCKPKMLEFEATIPEDLRCYLPINNVFTDVLTKRFGELVNPVLTSCMQRIGGETLSLFTRSTDCTSVSSFATIDSEDEHSKLHVVQNLEETPPAEPKNTLGCNSFNSPPLSSVDTLMRSQPEEMGSFSGDMDGETGEWFPPSKNLPPPAAYIAKEESIGEYEHEENESDDAASDEEYSDKLSKQVARDFLAAYDDELGRDDHFPERPNGLPSAIIPCSMFMVDSTPDDGGKHNSSCTPLTSNNGELIYQSNGSANHTLGTARISQAT